MIENALAAEDDDQTDDKPLPPIARRILAAREELGLTQDAVAARWGEPASMYWDLELYDDEALQGVSILQLSRLAAVLGVPLFVLLFGGEPNELPAVSFEEVVDNLKSRMARDGLSVDDLSNLAGWKLQDILTNPQGLRELPIFGLRWICKTAGVDWVITLSEVVRKPA